MEPLAVECTCLSISRDPLCVYHGDTAYKEIANQRDKLLAALHEAVRLIRLWHGMGMGPAEAQAWALYQGSPEMKRINAAIAPPVDQG